MAETLTFTVSETVFDLKLLIKTTLPIFSKRIQALLVFKKYENIGISKRKVAELVNANHNSIQKWRSLYIEGGIDNLLCHYKIGFKKNIISDQQKLGIGRRIKELNGRIESYKLFNYWFNKKYKKNISYQTFYKYVKRNFGKKIKL